MAVVKSAPRCKSSFNRCAGALPLVMSHAPSLHPTIGGNEVAPKSRLASTSPFTAAPSSRRPPRETACAEDSLPTRPIIFPRREGGQTRQTEHLKMYTFFSHPPPSLRSIPPSHPRSAACPEVAAAAALDISTRNLPLSLSLLPLFQTSPTSRKTLKDARRCRSSTSHPTPSRGEKEMNPSATFIFGLKRHCTGLAGGSFVPCCALMSVSISNSAVPVPSHRLPRITVFLFTGCPRG